MGLFRKTDPLPPATARHTAKCLFAERAFGQVASTSQSFSSTSSCALTSFYDDGKKKQPLVSGDLTLGGGDAATKSTTRRRVGENRIADMVGYGSIDGDNEDIATSSLAEKCGASLLSLFGGRQSSTSTSTTYSTGPKPSYKARRWFCCRKSDAIMLQQSHPDKIPIIIERFRRENRLPQLPKCQYVVPRYTTVGQLQHLIRTLLFDQSNMAIFVVVNDEIPSLMTTMEELALRYRDDDGFLYIQFTSEDCFG